MRPNLAVRLRWRISLDGFGFFFLGRFQQFWIDIYPGQVSYFTFTDEEGFKIVPPPVPMLDFLPGTAVP